MWRDESDRPPDNPSAEGNGLRTVSTLTRTAPDPPHGASPGGGGGGGGHRAGEHTIQVAITANIVIFIAKLLAWGHTSSSSMAAEAIHSVVDVFNQVLLLKGVRAARRVPTQQHPYGYLKDKFVWSLISGVAVFCLGGGISIAHGLQALSHTAPLEHLATGIGVLLVSTLVEGYSLSVALKDVRTGARAANMGVLQYLRKGRDPTSAAVLLEDAAAVTGASVAMACTIASHVTGVTAYDAAGSVIVGALLCATATFLIQTNRNALIGRAMSPEERQAVLDVLRRDDVVAAVYDTKSEEIGPGLYRFKAELEFSGDKIVSRLMEHYGREETLARFRKACEAGGTEGNWRLEQLLREFGSGVISANGAEIDRIESCIKKAVPGVRHVDIETDRGRLFRNSPKWPQLDTNVSRAPDVYKENGAPVAPRLGTPSLPGIDLSGQGLGRGSLDQEEVGPGSGR
ncbi:unnamed protein product [Pedinophyceae sp. YPF-701]|nr:unnamed protein product [Pedinophyceae sp. YPF-701]